MHIGNHYKLSEFLFWTRRDIYRLLLLATIPTALYHFLGWTWLAIPWVPIAMIGTAAAFIIGFKNTQTYNRLWEARQIWGGIVNSSRSWGMLVKHFVGNAEEHKAIHQELIYRHIAWLTALRYQLRETRPWENINKIYNLEYQRFYSIPEHHTPFEEALKPYLSEGDFQYVWGKKNRATQLISLQSAQLKKLKDAGLIDPLNYVELENQLVQLYDLQGRCERIKNFPYPRQFVSINLFFIRLFTFMVPLGLLQEFHKLGEYMIWLNIPFSVLVNWVFNTMEKIGEATENPFEGNANDVPISTLSRTIEIDLREMLDETAIPQPLAAMNSIQM
ncbi:MAG TPA: multidrug transporter [Chitinophagaceae bacterium]|nr:multidrug transporter [Chitinophagaceae bacterium]